MKNEDAEAAGAAAADIELACPLPAPFLWCTCGPINRGRCLNVGSKLLSSSSLPLAPPPYAPIVAFVWKGIKAALQYRI